MRICRLVQQFWSPNHNGHLNTMSECNDAGCPKSEEEEGSSTSQKTFSYFSSAISWDTVWRMWLSNFGLYKSKERECYTNPNNNLMMRWWGSTSQPPGFPPGDQSQHLCHMRERILCIWEFGRRSKKSQIYCHVGQFSCSWSDRSRNLFSLLCLRISSKSSSLG